MESWPSQYSQRDATTPEPAHPRHLVYSIYPDERRAARVAKLLVEAGFPPRKVYIGMRRGGELREARAGRGRMIAAVMLVCASLTAAIGSMWMTSAALGLTDFPLGPLAGRSAITVSILGLVPMAIPGALLGWLIGALTWRKRGDFPAQSAPGGRTFVGVEVSHASMPDAQLTLTDPHDALVANPDEEWRGLAQRELFASAAS